MKFTKFDRFLMDNFDEGELADLIKTYRNIVECYGGDNLELTFGFMVESIMRIINNGKFQEGD